MGLIKCPECGKEISDMAVACPNCGKPMSNTGEGVNEQQVSSAVSYGQENIQPTAQVPYGQMNAAPKAPKKRGCLGSVIGFLLVCGVIGAIIAGISGSMTGENAKVEEGAKENLIIDANQFSRISSAELVKILGEPEVMEDTEHENDGETFSAKIYSYQNHRYEFTIIEDKVVQFAANSPKYNDVNAEGFPYGSEKQLFAMFGLPVSDGGVKIADTGYALRYQLISDKVDDYWIQDIDKETNTFNIARITYDQLYFGSLTMPLSEKSDLQYKCQETIKTILKSPSTAKFPNILEWSIGKTRKGIVVQSYVDSQNSFGAELRNEFQFIIKDGTITSLIFDGQEVMNK